MSSLSADKWVKYFSLHENNEFFSELLKICQFVFAIPGQNVNVERIFSMITTQWTKDRNRLNITTLRAISTIAYNFKNMNCEDFYNKIINEKEVLIQIASSAKYSADSDEENL